MAKVPQAQQKPRPRKVMVLLTDDEWRAVRIAAAARDTSIQGYVSNVVLAKLQGDDRVALDQASNSGGH